MGLRAVGTRAVRFAGVQGRIRVVGALGSLVRRGNNGEYNEV